MLPTSTLIFDRRSRNRIDNVDPTFGFSPRREQARRNVGSLRVGGTVNHLLPELCELRIIEAQFAYKL
jgi:hypothetical protein